MPIFRTYYLANLTVHFASIPDTKTSQLCYEALKNKDSAYFKCEMDSRWKRYKPIYVI